MTARSTIFGACVCVCSAAVAAETPQQACCALEEALCRETALLAGVTDASSAAAVLPELRACLQGLAAMRGADEDALWNYIDNTPGVKTRLAEAVQRLAIQFQRLEQAEFYRCTELADALAPQLQSPAE